MDWWVDVIDRKGNMIRQMKKWMDEWIDRFTLQYFTNLFNLKMFFYSMKKK